MDLAPKNIINSQLTSCCYLKPEQVLTIKLEAETNGNHVTRLV